MLQTKEEIKETVATAYLIPQGEKYGLIWIEAIWVDDENEVTVDGWMSNPDGERLLVFTNSKIGENWVPAMKQRINN